MEVGINNHLKRIASDLFIKFDGEERRKIEISVKNIFYRLEEYFENEIDNPILFGSYSRDTILPRRFDPNSDIDILVQFNINDYDRLQPESYRNQLRRFAIDNYPNSIVVKDHPSVVLELNHIKFDLVPAIFNRGIFYGSIEIPNKKGGWMETKPQQFSEQVKRANMKFNSIVKPLIRLAKYWNAENGYPYFSYELEKSVVAMNFSGENLESGFCNVIRSLSSYYLPTWAARKVDALKSNGKWLEEYLDRGNVLKVKQTLNRILPGFV